MKKKILIVDDLAGNRRILNKMLCNDYEVIEAANGKAALQIMLGQYMQLSAVLLDIMMPETDGYEVLRRMRDNPVLVQIPVIMITGIADAAARVEALALGANDIVMKPYNSEIIKHCLQNNILLRELASKINLLQRDRLTNLYSRDAFFEKAETLINSHEPGYYIMACSDIDNFKVINDQYGTAKGDAVLRHVAAIFKQGFERMGGICCRMSGDNFAVLYPASFQNSPEIETIKTSAAMIDGLIAPLVFSIGRYVANDLSLSPSAMHDRALLAAESIKKRYDNKIAYYDEAMRENIIKQQQVVTEMEKALAGEQFEVWFQPQYNHSTYAMIGAEALVRWRHPQKGLIPPQDFIPVFEQNGFIYPLDKYVWEQVCRYLRKWIDTGRNPLPVSVNISRYDVFCPDFIEIITGLVGKYNLPVDLLRLEITETAFAQSTEQIIAVIKELIDYGFTIEIDDFGSGYSSLNTLKDVPAQIIKLDMKFLDSSGDSERGGNIVESVVRMAKWLGMSVIAEGVETRQQANYLLTVGCAYMQGFLYARPMPAEEYEQHCAAADKEEKLLTLETVENLDNNSFWNPDSMDTLIFNSYVGGACIFEYHHGKIELVRASEKYAQVIGSSGMTVEDVLKLNWAEHLDEEGSRQVAADIEKSIATKSEVAGEYVFYSLPGCPYETYLRSTLRVIAAAGERYLIYCTNENITAQRQAELRERQAAEQIRAIMADVDSGITATVLNGSQVEFLFSNDKYYAMLGYTREEYHREVTDSFSLIHPDDRERVYTQTMQAFSTQNPLQIEYRIIRPDTQERWLKVGITSTRFTGIEDNVHLAVFTDVSDEKRASRALQDTSTQLQSMMNDMPGGFVRMQMAPDGSIKPVYINAGFLKLNGMNYEEVMQIYADDALAGVHPDDVHIVRAMIAVMLDKGVARSSRYRLIKKDGGYLWVTVFARLTKDLDDNTYLNIYYTDTTQQIEEERIQESLLDNLPGGAGLYEYCDGELCVLYFNESYWKLVDRKPADYAGLEAISGVHPDDAPVIARELASAIEQKRDMSCDIRLRRETGGYCLVHLVGHIVPSDANGYFIYAIFTPIVGEGMTYQQVLPLLLSAVMDSTNDLAFAKDTSLRYLSASRTFAAMAGKASGSEVVGKTDYDLFSREIADKFRRDDLALLADGRPIVDMVEPIPAVGGVPHYSSTSKYLLHDGTGAVVGLYGVGRDVTENIAMQTRLELLTNSIPGGIAMYEGRPEELEQIKLSYFSDGFCKLFGYSREEYEKLAAVNPLGLVFAEDLESIYGQVLDLVKEGIPMDYIYRAKTKQGNHKWINVKAVLGEPGGDRVRINAVFFDVTELQEAMERMRISEEENRLAMRHTHNAVCRYDVASRTVRIPAGTQQEYLFADEVENVPYSSIDSGLIAPESVAAYIALYEEIRAGNPNGSSVIQRKLGGKWCWLQAHYSTIFSTAGEPVSAVISFVDITEQLEKDSAYQRWQQRFHNRPSESYTMLRCNISKKSSYDAREGTLLATALVQKNCDFEQQTAQYAAQFVAAEDRQRFISHLQADTLLASYYQGKRSLILEYRDLSGGGVRWLRLTIDLVEQPHSSEVEAYLLFENIDEAKREELTTRDLAEKDPLTGVMNRSAFAARVNHLLHNLQPNARSVLLMLDIDGFKLVNDAFGHSAGDDALIEIGAALRSALRSDDLIGRLGGDEFVVFMADIPSDAIAAGKAQQICALARKSFSAEVEISGSVGIAVAFRDGDDFETLYKKADAALYHVKGSGKDNYVFYHDDMADEHLEPETETAIAARAKEPAKKRRMLIVDDNRIHHELLQNIFKDDFIIERAKDGNSALIRLRHYGSAVSVVLLDLMMPGMDGFAVLEKIQQSNEMRSIPVIVVSGDDNRDTCLKVIQKGATDFVTKPVDADILRIRVQSAISKAENERLRAKNSLLELQNQERNRFEAALNSTGIVFVEYDWLKGEFTYYPSISKYLSGTYDNRKFWQILLSDMVADTLTVQKMQKFVHSAAASREQMEDSITVMLKTPQGVLHRFRMKIHKLTGEFKLTNQMIITLDDLD